MDLEFEIITLRARINEFKLDRCFSGFATKDEWREHYANIKQFQILKDIERKRVIQEAKIK